MATIAQTYQRFKIYLFNTSWIVGERILRMIVSFLVTIVVARYLGPKNFGILAYATSLTAVFASIGHMGLSGLVVREIVKYPDEKEQTLGTVAILKVVGSCAAIVAILFYLLLFENFGSLEFWILLVVSLTIFFKPFEIFDFWFQSHLQAKYTAISRSCSLFLFSGFRLVLVLLSSPLLFFAFSNVLQAVLMSCFLLLFYRKKSQSSPLYWNFSFNKAKEFLSKSWIVFLGSMFAAIYLKIDQVMIKWYLGMHDVGVYAISASLSEYWYFVPAAIVTSFFPKLIELKEQKLDKYNERFQQLFDLLFMLAFLVAIFVSGFSEPIIKTFYGEKYIESITILTIHIWSALFIFMRAAFSRWILIEDALIFSLITQGFGAISNVGFNLLLIPHYGGVGAAMATLLSYSIASYFSLFFYKKSRPVFWMMTRAVLSPIRYPYRYVTGFLV